MLINWCFCNWTTANWLSLIGIIISIGTLTLGIIAYNKFLVKPFREKQLQVVCDLINQINNEWNHFVFQDPNSNPFRGRWGNVFDIAELPETDEDGNFYSFATEDESRFHPDRGVIDSGIYDVEDQTFDEIIHMEFFRFHNNPLLPITIAQVLKKFSLTHFTGSKTIGEIRKEKGYVIMGARKVHDDQTVCHYYSDKPTWNSYILLCKELKKAILEWGEKYGLDDLNITISHNFKTE